MERGDIRYRTCINNKILESIIDFNSAVKLLDDKVNKNILNSDTNHSPTNHNNNNNSGRKQSRASLSGSICSDTSKSLDSLVSIVNINKDKITKKLLINPNVKHSPGNSSARGDGSNSSRKIPPETLIDGQSNREYREQLGESLFRRAQAKLLLEVDNNNIENKNKNINEALSDAKESMIYAPFDDDYHLIVVVCYMRLLKFDEAINELQIILLRSPTNEKALFHMATCLRQGGRLKDAISNLSKVNKISFFFFFLNK